MRHITKIDFEEWLNNEVTMRFLSEIKEDFANCQNERIVGDHEQMIRMAHERNAAMEIFENVLTWKPSELIEESK